jgi:phosphatidylglycerophosphate synthase
MAGLVKRVPDLLTASRAVIAVAIATLGFVGPRALEAVVLLIILGWTTDILDGRLARRWKKDPTWIGEKEFAFDMVMVVGGLCYLVMAGFFPPVIAGIYVAVAALVIAFFRSKSVTMSFAFPLVALPLVVSWFNAPRAALWFTAWIAVAVVLDRKRFKGVVLEFISNYRAIRR